MASHQHAHGNSENVLGFTKDNKVFINDEPLKKMFLHADVKNRKIVAFSIIGAYRKGKSFFLDYCLRYLYAHYPSINNPKNSLSNPTDWLGDENEPLSGFSWRSGTDRDTTGIVMWNDVFLHTIERTGEKVAIVVMDTQGLFDNQTSPMDNSKIFALGTLISSIQVLNLSGLIQEDQLQYLQFATEFAKYAASNNQGLGGKCFQNLMFLIRDWENPDNYYYGKDGGHDYLQNYLKINENQKEALKSVRKYIKESFDDLSCFLLPHPGTIVTGVKKHKNLKYDGRHAGMDEDFKTELAVLIDNLLNPKNLVTKKVNHHTISSAEFHDYVQNLFTIFKSDQLPKAQTIYDSTVDGHLTNLVNLCLNDYKNLVNDDLETVTDAATINILHQKCKTQVMLNFIDTKKMGNAKNHLKFKKILDDKIEKNSIFWKCQKEAFLKGIEEFRQHQMDLEVEKLAALADEVQLIKMQTEVNRQQLKTDLKLIKKSKAQEIKKIKKMTKSRQRNHEKFLKSEKLKAKLEIVQISLKKDQEMRRLNGKDTSLRLQFYYYLVTFALYLVSFYSFMLSLDLFGSWWKIFAIFYIILVLIAVFY
ncbi:atlastin-like isoform X2 [Chironomus tepperi]|uniref:atlastin-like isoform X2 n=1 Tax=Chironomus tepperi TaxID=113505 RepID=UPI00391F1E7F